jgi:hypothetical protein
MFIGAGTGEEQMAKAAISNPQVSVTSEREFATADDFQQLFASDMADLFRLAYLLTADAEEAELCLILTIRECMASSSVFRWWLPVWTRNALIRNALRIVTGSPARCLGKMAHDRMLSAIRRSQQSAMDALDQSPAILQLSDLDRLVYVICLVEHYPIGDCAMLLGRSRQEVREAKERAVRQVIAFEQEWRRLPDPLPADLFVPPSHAATGAERSSGSLLA